MLKEGWDVNNLYTIVPLRAANARTLIEQSIGRGLRLPDQAKSSIPILDTLNIIAHDKFQEIVDEARKADSLIKLKSILLDETTLGSKYITIISKSIIEQKLVSNQYDVGKKLAYVNEPEEIFKNEKEREIAQLAYQAIKKFESKPDQVPTIFFLNRPEIKECIVKEVEANHIFSQKEFDFEYDNKINLSDVVDKTIELFNRKMINIPQIVEVPKEEVNFKFAPFQLDLSKFHFSIVSEDLWIQELRTGLSKTISRADKQIKEELLENIIVKSLLEYDDISYEENSDFLFYTAKQRSP